MKEGKGQMERGVVRILASHWLVFVTRYRLNVPGRDGPGLWVERTKGGGPVVPQHELPSRHSDGDMPP